jgi:DNA-binding GntR family transcriptional regulator
MAIGTKGRLKEPVGSLSRKAYLRIRDGILHGDYSLGAALRRRQLATDFGMSVLPVSEALQRLEMEGLVETQPRVGTRVRIPTPQDVRGHVIVREALESQSARLFATKATREQRDELRRKALELDHLWDSLKETNSNYREKLYRAHDLHTQFHMRIAECSGYRALHAAIQRNQVLVFMWIYDLFLGEGMAPPRWHTQLMDVVAGHDPIRAHEVMRNHVQQGLDRLLEKLEPYLQWDEGRLRDAAPGGGRLATLRVKRRS